MVESKLTEKNFHLFLDTRGVQSAPSFNFWLGCSDSMRSDNSSEWCM